MKLVSCHNNRLFALTIGETLNERKTQTQKEMKCLIISTWTQSILHAHTHSRSKCKHKCSLLCAYCMWNYFSIFFSLLIAFMLIWLEATTVELNRFHQILTEKRQILIMSKNEVRSLYQSHLKSSWVIWTILSRHWNSYRIFLLYCEQTANAKRQTPNTNYLTAKIETQSSD